ncbi:L,D-transpeptidase family protein [Altererythrobacter aerius]|uniref:L,D-transpeptidase family protein n=1 Tax=Tsuneonella aeria TaxID=1837929 RepID=A0A6I4TEZ4_9SPHN|nr:L,D-transpeptidase family protein [Tsuneonella aeria]MXO75832.1 L,D-transpeptidase family protein [Tsuneonella aeria]
MHSLAKWSGGAIAAIALGFGGAALASGAFSSRHATHPATTAELAIPVETASLAAREPTEAETPFTVKRILPIDDPIRYGEWHWDEEGVAPGPIVMTVDLDARVLSVFRGGHEIGAAAVLLGTDDYPTPLGTFPILRKQRHNVSEKYDDAPMPWSMFLTTDGVAIHGGSEIENGYASHGCIAGPDEFISRIFAIAGPGDKVIITRGETMQIGDPIV